MPRPSRRKAAQKRNLTKDEVRWFLLGGFCIVNPDANPDRAKEIWEQARKAILTAWIEVLPGCRPFAWWKFEAQEPRRCISDVHLYDTDNFPEPLKKFVFGLPTISDRRGKQEFESEFDYLNRLDLLMEPEKDMNPEKMRLNSVAWIRRTDEKNISRILRQLGFE